MGQLSVPHLRFRQEARLTYKQVTKDVKQVVHLFRPLISVLETQLWLGEPPASADPPPPPTSWLPLGPLVCCIIVYFAVENVMFSHLGAHSPGPIVSPIPCPERPLISLVSQNSTPIHLL